MRAFIASSSNQPWLPLAEKLQNLDWHHRQDFYSVRLFLVLKSANGAGEAGPHHPDAATVERYLKLLLEACSANPDIEDDELYQLLSVHGSPGRTARQLVTFGPIGFSAILFAAGNLSEEYALCDTEGKIVDRYLLVDEPVFLVARFLAMMLANGTDEQAQSFYCFASRCALCGPVNQALDAGHDITGIKFSPIMVVGVEPSGPRVSSVLEGVEPREGRF